MPIKPGQILNPKGRPQGAKDKVNTEIRDKFRELVADNYEQLQEDIKSLKPRERIDAIIKLANFILPKLQSIQLYEVPEVAELLLMTKEERKIELARLRTEFKTG